ncbi:MAG: Xylan 1,4-beta-xylosidase precursor [Bacteroidota bacterium]|jgi:beta-glucosidase
MKITLKAVVLGLLCTSTAFAQLPYQNPTLTAQERAADLTSRLTLKEKISLMVDASQSVDRLGIKTYNWWNEALHGVARAGVATVFPQPIGMAASFDTPNVFRVFTAVSDEARAKNTRFAQNGTIKRYQGLTMWTPNVNIFRDPRWGRGMETYGEDPCLTAQMGVAVVKALQGPEGEKYDKLHACAKHFAVHSGPEWNRHTFDAENISRRDLYETYLPAFKALVQDAKVKEVMCAYNRLEGEPCCGNKKLLNYILRKEWGYDGIVVADCGAIADFYRPNAHGTHPDAASASAEAVLTGTDLDCGSSYPALMESVEKGLIKESDIDVSINRLLKARFELGEMDDPSLVSWTKIPYSVVASAAHDSLAYVTALKSMVLLQNKNAILPLKKGMTIAVMGPNACDSVMLWGNYNGTPRRTLTILDGIRQLAGKDAKVIYEKGCNHVERTLFQSAFGSCSNEKGKGFTATYWNNNDRTGEPVANAQVSTPFNFCTSGATVFAPGVNLTNFGASYKTTFTAPSTGELNLNFYYCGQIKLIVNQAELKSLKANHGSRNSTVKMPVEQGKQYEIELQYNYTMGDAQLNFDLGYQQDINLQQSVAAVQDADVVVFVGGISPNLEGEEMGVNLPGFKGGDRTDIELPAIQRELMAALHQAGKKVVFVNCSGSTMGLVPETKNCDAILQAWYPGQDGGKAVAAVLYGDYNPAGRLPLTFYKNINQVPDFLDYSMKGRTYRYFSGEALFPFGYGLSYTTFSYDKPKLQAKDGRSMQLSITVKNAGKRNGDEVVQLYLKKLNDEGGPQKELRAFSRVQIAAGKSKTVQFNLGTNDLQWWDNKAEKMQIVPGKYRIMIGGSSRTADLQSIVVDIK